MIFLIIKTLAEPDKVCGLLGCPSANIFGSPPLAQRLLIIPMLIHHVVNHHHWWLWLCHDWVWRYFCFADYRRHQWTKGPLVQGRSFCTWMDSKICPLAVSYQLLAKHGFFLKIFWWQHLSILSSSFLSLGSLRRPSFRSTTRPALDQQSCANHTARVVTNMIGQIETQSSFHILSSCWRSIFWLWPEYCGSELECLCQKGFK